MKTTERNCGKCAMCSTFLYIINDEHGKVVQSNVGYFRGEKSKNNLCLYCNKKASILSEFNKIAQQELVA